MGYLLGYSSTARFKKFCNLFLQFFGKFAESLRVSRDHKELKNVKLAYSCAVDQNWSFPTNYV